MRKIILSLSFLLILLLCAWGISAWIMGQKNEQRFNAFISTESLRGNAFFYYEILNFDRSVFSSSAEIKLHLNMNNNIARLAKSSSFIPKNHIVKLEILHGPILFDQSGFQLGWSSWNVNFDENISTKDLTNNFQQDDAIQQIKSSPLTSAKLIFNFKDSLDYKIPIKTDFNDVQIKGHIDLNSQEHKGNLIANQLVYKDIKQNIYANALVLNYHKLFNDSKDLAFKFTSTVEVLSYTYKDQSSTLSIGAKLKHSGKISLQNNLLNTENRFSLVIDEDANNPKYPVETAELLFEINDLNIDGLIALDAHVDKLRNLQEQSEWVLNEQGEYPEGQDKIWLLQDETTKLYKQLPILISNLLLVEKNNANNQSDNVNNKEPNSTIKFDINTQLSGENSTLIGSMLPGGFNLNQDISVLDISEISLLSLIQAQATVSLDDGWFRYLSNRLPITQTNFKLVYKQNKLLMQ